MIQQESFKKLRKANSTHRGSRQDRRPTGAAVDLEIAYVYRVHDLQLQE